MVGKAPPLAKPCAKPVCFLPREGTAGNKESTSSFFFPAGDRDVQQKEPSSSDSNCTRCRRDESTAEKKQVERSADRKCPVSITGKDPT